MALLDPRSSESTADIHSWYRALTMRERMTAGRPPLDAATDADANRRLERWRAQKPLNDDRVFEAFLSMHELNADGLLALLSESSDGLCARQPVAPDWLQTLERPSTGAADVSAALSPNDDRLLAAVAPVLRTAMSWLRGRIERLTRDRDDLPFTFPTVMSLLHRNLGAYVLPLLGRTFALEVNVARLQGRLAGDTTEARFEDFLRQLADGAIWPLLREYPVLARQLTVQSEHWCHASAELLERLADDWPAICATFSPETPGLLAEIRGGIADTHREGRSVLTLAFSGGFRLVYKPRSLALDVHFQQLLQWLNERGDHAPFRVTRLCDRGDYGWVEFIEAGGCDTSAEVERFYERQGGFLALLHMLQATDFHYENVIAAGEHPVPIDLEALFHPVLHGMAHEWDDPAAEELGSSVLITGLLPQRAFGDAGQAGIDLSGFNGHAGQLSPQPGLRWRGVGTDRVHAVRERLELPGQNNRPRLQGRDVALLDYVEHIATGFRKIYRLVLREKDAIVCEWLPRFADDEIRLLVRPTNGYARLLQEASHPDLMRDALDRDRFFSMICVASGEHPWLRRLVPSEIADLWRGDIPMFTTRPGSRDVYDSGGACRHGLLAQSGLERVRRRLAAMDESDLTRQLWIVRAALASIREGEAHWHGTAVVPSSRECGAPALLQAARRAGSRLVDLAASRPDGAGWLCLGRANAREWSVSTAGIDLYDGLPGIILALAYLGDVTGDVRYTTVARDGLRTLRRKAPTMRGQLKRIGAFNGWGSLIYLYSHLYALWGDAKLLDDADAALAQLEWAVDDDETLDIVGGAAGGILALLSLHSVSGSARALDAARRCGQRLIREVPRDGDRRHLTGWSHGAAGFAYSLLALAGASGDLVYRNAAREWISYERSFFCAEHQNWRDLRATGDEHGCQQTTWCHGAAGIGLARLAGSSYAHDAIADEEIRIAVDATIARGFGLNHSLCHGDLGNLELLLTGARLQPEGASTSLLPVVTAAVLASLDRGYAPGTPLGVETPGLMTGLAGIAYQLARLAHPERVPAVLLLESPRTRALPTERMVGISAGEG